MPLLLAIDSFHVGYLQRPSQAKQWIVSSDDLDCIYAKLSGNEVSLWYDMRVTETVDKQHGPVGKLNNLPVLMLMDHPQSEAQNRPIMLCVRMN